MIVMMKSEKKNGNDCNDNGGCGGDYDNNDVVMITKKIMVMITVGVMIMMTMMMI